MTDGIKRSRTLPMIAFLIPTLTTALVLSAQPAEPPGTGEEEVFLDTGDISEFSDCVVVLGGEAPVQENPTLSASDLRSLGLQPLPDEKVDWLFKKIAREERVEPDILHAALIGPQSALRADAARISAQWGDASSIPHLIHALTDESYHLGGDYPDAGMATTRYWAARSLREMTGRDLGFVWNDPLDQRNAAVLRWSTWFQTVDANGETRDRRMTRHHEGAEPMQPAASLARRFWDPRLRSALEHLAGGRDPEARKRAAFILAGRRP